MRYIDFDGVILDTEDVLFDEWRRYIKAQEIMTKIEYIQQKDWMKVLADSSEINDALYYLREMNPNENAILTKVHSMENEATAKIKYLKEKNIKVPVIIVPYTVEKIDVVDATNNELIDDSLYNLTKWKEAGGEPLFFDIKGNNIDSWNQENTYGYKRVRTIRKTRHVPFNVEPKK